MRKPIALLTALVALPGGELFAQNLAGTWQGLMLVSQTPGDTLHVVFKITTTVGGSLKADMYSIDQGGRAPGLDVTLKGSVISPMPTIGATYIGNLSADGSSITGKWAGPGNALTLNLVRATADTAWKIPEAPPPPRLMPADADPKFDVATIKPANPGGRGGGFRVQGRQISAMNMSVSNLMLFAYGLHPRQLIGAPDWVEKDRYDILGKPDVEGQPNNRQMRALIQKLLADRFSLKFHREKRELSVYAIAVGKSGAKLTASEGDPKGDPNMFFYGAGKFIAKNATIADFAGLLQQGILDRPVLDQTGLAARYDFGLVYRPDQPLVGAPGDNPQTPSDQDALQDIYGAVQQQLGLRLESAKIPTEVIVIDHVEKPPEN